MQVSEVMTVDPLVLAVDETLLVAEMFMRLAHIRHLPVVDGSRVVGLVTHRDLLAAATGQLASERADGDETAVQVKEIMREGVRTVESTTDARKAIDLMIDHKYGCLPVTQDGHLVGIVTEADFLKFARRCLDQE